MKKSLIALLLLPVLNFAQSTSNLTPLELKQVKLTQSLHAAYEKSQFISPSKTQDKVLKLVLDSMQYDDFYTNPDEYVPFYMNRFIYDNTGRNTAKYLWIYDFLSDTIAKTFYNYNIDNQIISSFTESRFSGSWEPSNNKYYYYDVNGLMIQEVDSSYNTTNSVYELDMTFNFTYDGSNKLIEIFGLLADDQFVTYLDQKIIFEYDVNGNMVKETLYFQNSDLINYDEKRIYNFSYNGSNSNITLNEVFDNNTSSMLPNGSTNKFYTNSSNKSDLILPFEPIYRGIFNYLPENEIGSYTNKLDSMHLKNNDLSLDASAKFYYTQKDIIAVEKLNKDNFLTIYPNPTNGIVNFGMQINVEIFDMFGRKILETKASKIDLSSLENGMYQLIMKEKGSTHIQRVILNK